MATTSPFLNMILQATGENPDQWGDVLNVSAIELLEDAIAGTATVDVTSGNQVLDTTVGGPTPSNHYRFAMINVIGTPGTARQITVPAKSKIFLVINATTDSSDITVTAGGAAATVLGDEKKWVFCDGTDVIEATAGTATTALTANEATNALNLGGDPAADFAKINAVNSWSKGQTIPRIALTNSGGDITPNLNNSNSFYHLTTGNFNVATPTNPQNGSMFSLIVEQGAGAPHTITFQANTFLWQGGSPPTLSTVFGDIDYLAFEYVTNGINRWIGSIIKGVS